MTISLEPDHIVLVRKFVRTMTAIGGADWTTPRKSGEWFLLPAQVPAMGRENSS